MFITFLRRIIGHNVLLLGLEIVNNFWDGYPSEWRNSNFPGKNLFFSQNIRMGVLHITLISYQAPHPYVSLLLMGIYIT